MSYDDLARNLDTYGDGEDGPEVQEYYKALAGLDILLKVLSSCYVSGVNDFTDDDLMSIIEYVFEHFDDPREDAPAPEMLRLLTVITSNWNDADEPDQNAFAGAMSEADDLVERLTQKERTV